MRPIPAKLPLWLSAYPAPARVVGNWEIGAVDSDEDDSPRLTVARVEDADGNIITDGLQTCDVSDEAVSIAQRTANRRGEPVTLYDADGSWTIRPEYISDSRHPVLTPEPT